MKFLESKTAFVLVLFILFLPSVYVLKALAEDTGSNSGMTTTNNDQKLIDIGKQYFTGSRRFENGGPACNTCHNVNSPDLIPGGLLAKDLTKVYERFGPGISGFMDNPPVSMLRSYGRLNFTESEKQAVVKFLEDISKKGTEERAYGGAYLILGGGGIAMGLLGLIGLAWNDRKKRSVNEDIFKRQIKASN